MSNRLTRWAANAVAEQAVGIVVLKAGGYVLSLIISGILALFAYDRNVPWWVAILVLALTLYALASGFQRFIEAVVRHNTPKPAQNEVARSSSPHPTAYEEAAKGGIHVNVGTIHQNANQRVQAIQWQADRTVAEPHIEFTNPFIGPRIIDAWGCLRTATESPNVDVMLARFYYKPERNVPPFLFVKAHISIANAQGTPIKARYDATWDEECDSASVRLGTAETCVVVVAVLPPPENNEGESILTWWFGSNKDGFAPDSTILKGGEFILTLELVGKDWNDVVLHTSLDFRLNVNRRSMELI